MARKGTRKSKAKIPLKVPKDLTGKINTGPMLSPLPETGAEKPKEVEQSSAPPTPEVSVLESGIPTFRPEVPMVNLLASIHDVGRLSKIVPANKVDETLEKIWQTGFKQKLPSRQRTHQVYGPHMIDRIDVEPII